MLSLNGKAKAVYDWAMGWPEFSGYLKLNATVIEQGEASMVTDAGAKVITPYLDGTAIRSFRFNLRLVLPWSSGFDGINEESLALATKLYDWVETESGNGSYPKWPGAKITDLQNDENAPALNFVYQDDGLAEYLLPITITYEE